jgi:hypothetical protein
VFLLFSHPGKYVFIMKPLYEGRMTLTFIIVAFETGTNLPAVSVNSLWAVAMMKARQR